MSYPEGKKKAKSQKHPGQEVPAPFTEESYRQKVLEARQMSPEDKFLAGERLFRLECEARLEKIRNESPGATESECLRILEERLRLEEDE